MVMKFRAVSFMTFIDIMIQGQGDGHDTWLGAMILGSNDRPI